MIIRSCIVHDGSVMGLAACCNGTFADGVTSRRQWIEIGGAIDQDHLLTGRWIGEQEVAGCIRDGTQLTDFAPEISAILRLCEPCFANP